MPYYQYRDKLVGISAHIDIQDMHYLEVMRAINQEEKIQGLKPTQWYNYQKIGDQDTKTPIDVMSDDALVKADLYDRSILDIRDAFQKEGGLFDAWDYPATGKPHTPGTYPFLNVKTDWTKPLGNQDIYDMHIEELRIKAGPSLVKRHYYHFKDGVSGNNRALFAGWEANTSENWEEIHRSLLVIRPGIWNSITFTTVITWGMLIEPRFLEIGCYGINAYPKDFYLAGLSWDGLPGGTLLASWNNAGTHTVNITGYNFLLFKAIEESGEGGCTHTIGINKIEDIEV